MLTEVVAAGEREREGEKEAEAEAEEEQNEGEREEGKEKEDVFVGIPEEALRVYSCAPEPSAPDNKVFSLYSPTTPSPPWVRLTGVRGGAVGVGA
jgi:hypothetical protein